MRRIIGLFLILLLGLGAIADRVSVVELFLRVPSWLKFGLGWLTPWENWLADNQIHPLPLALAIVVFFALVVTPADLRRLVPRGRRRSLSADFVAAYDSERQRSARRDFRWGIERCFRRYAEREHRAWENGTLARLIDDLHLPADFPPAGRPVAQWLTTATWPGPEAQELWRFVRCAFANALRPEENELLGADYRGFLQAEQTTAQFWDDWGSAIAASRFTPKTTQRQIAANMRDIKLLALAELALTELVPWDEGEKSGLFLLAAKLARPGMSPRATAGTAA